MSNQQIPLPKPPAKSVLFIDDDRAMVNRFAEALRMRGFQVQPVYETDDLWKLFEDPSFMPPQFALVDIMMPYGDKLEQEGIDTEDGLNTGITIVKRLKERCPQTHVLVLSNRAYEEVVEQALPPEVKRMSKFELSGFDVADILLGYLG